jgi:hypothetical protein
VASREKLEAPQDDGIEDGGVDETAVRPEGARGSMDVQVGMPVHETTGNAIMIIPSIPRNATAGSLSDLPAIRYEMISLVAARADHGPGICQNGQAGYLRHRFALWRRPE